MTINVSADEKNAMARLIALMNQGVEFDEPAVSAPVTDYDYSSMPSDYEYGYGSSPVAESIAPRPTGLSMADIDPSVAAMKNFLQIINGGSAEQPVQRLTERSTIDRELREALVTETTGRGTRVGSWEIITHEDRQGLTSFDVTNVHTGEPIASSLTVYDAALGIARHLNEGRTINGREIRDILNVEAAYDRNRQDAALFKARMESCNRSGNYTRSAIMEDRYIESLEKAKVARVRLTKITR